MPTISNKKEMTMKKYLNSFTDLSKKFYEEKGIPEPKIFFNYKKKIL
jgi:hypothetical protein